MYQKLSLWLLSATLLFGTTAFAEEPEVPIQPSTPSIVVEEKSSSLSLEEAVSRALAWSPRLKAFSSSIEASKGELLQSGAWQNPEIGLEAENFAGSGPYNGFDSAEVTYGVTQQLEIGGKIPARKKIAGKGLEIASIDQQVATLDLIRDVTVAYAEAVAAEETVRLASEQKDLAADVLKSVGIRVNAAAAPLIQRSRAEVERSTTAIALDIAMRERDISRISLAALLGEEQLFETLDTSSFYVVSAPNPISIEDGLKTNPDLAKLDTTLEQSKGMLDLEKANAVPDPRISVGVRDLRDSGDQAFVVGISLPIPVFNANQGNIGKARNTVLKNEFDNQQAALLLRSELIRAEQQMETAYMQAEILNTEIMPSADKAFSLAREGYGLGRFPYLEVLDAQRSLFGVKQQRIAALKSYHISRATVERLTAANLAKINATGESHAE